MNDELVVTKRDGRREAIDLEKIHRIIIWAAEGLEDVSVGQRELMAHLDFYSSLRDGALHTPQTTGAVLTFHQGYSFPLFKQQAILRHSQIQHSLSARLLRRLSALRETGSEAITRLLLSCGHITRAPPSSHAPLTYQPRPQFFEFVLSHSSTGSCLSHYSKSHST